MYKLYVETMNATKKEHFTAKAKGYLLRAERLKKLINERQLAGTYRELMKIEDGSTGHGYASVFGRFMDVTVTHIDIEDPYVRMFHQVTRYYR